MPRRSSRSTVSTFRVAPSRLSTTPCPGASVWGPWYYYQSASLDGGFDLRPWAGKRVTLTSYALTETHSGQPARLWTVQLGDRIIGAYVAVDGDVPGIYGLREAASQW